ncbi:M56 family metallopeptidase [Phenylobacterium sp.]|uniref:M56 family metallopeptidase n=1 Tax=Phenylobacterium sp. TaxID=1871053 RepID=UPI002CF5D2BD|nr:M56 family metallopeptidase [Phenylobacterium sp.]HLZ76497.1 M56 family metallopeptidase [Phenylobacterium sp.]
MQQLLAGYLVNAAWQIPVVAFCAFLVSRFGGLSPQARNRLWLLFLGIAAVLPAVSLAALLPHAAPTVARVPVDAVAAAAIEAAAPDPDVLVPAAQPALELSAWSAWAMTAFSAAVVALLIVRLSLAARAAGRLVRQSRPVVLPSAVATALERLAQAHGRIAAPVRSSKRVSSPAVVGAVSPVILIPDGLAVADDDLRAALLHEMAHVIRHDYAVNLACEVMTLPVCWHPALATLKAGVAKSRELACDAMAADAIGSSKTYARRLVSLAQTLGAQSHGIQTLGGPTHAMSRNAALAVGLFGRSDLEDRLMHLMKPKDTEAPALRAARLCGLAAVGAGLLGSAALLHVTPVFAQPATPVTAQPLAPPSSAATAATRQAQTDAAKPETATPATHRHHGVIINDGNVIVSAADGRYPHTFKASDGRDFTVYTDDAKEPSPEQQREFEAQVQKAEARAAEAVKRVNSPEFKARIAAATARAAEAEARVNSPEFKARIAAAEARAADAEKMINSPEFKARIAAAEARGAEAEKMVNSPEFKARIAAAQAHAADVEKMINSPEFKARIARAAEAGARFNTPEFKERMERMQKRLDELSRDDAPATPSSPDAPKPTP